MLRQPVAALFAAALVTVALASPSSAIVYGQRDTSGDFDNVGALIRLAEFPDESVHPVIWCSGTLIDDDVFLTAAHCLFELDPENPNVWVSFLDQVPLSDPELGIVDMAAADPIAAESAHLHPDAFCCGANDWFDMGVVMLDPENTVTPSITPASLPSLDLLGQMSNAQLRSATFTAVGYGAVRESRKQAFQGLINPEGWRSFAHQSALSLTKAWFTLSMNQATGDAGTCFGDSGGPHFLATTVVSVTVTGDVWCKATDKTYRLDTPAARSFLSAFVSLP